MNIMLFYWILPFKTQRVPPPQKKTTQNKPNKKTLATHTLSCIFTIKLIQRTNFVTEQTSVAMFLSASGGMPLIFLNWMNQAKGWLFLSLTSGVSLECDEEYLKEILGSFIESVGDSRQLN